MKLWRDGSLIFNVKTLQRVLIRKEKKGLHLLQSFKRKNHCGQFFAIVEKKFPTLMIHGDS